MNDNFKRLVLEFYEARRKNAESTIRSMLSEDVVWHEPKVNEVTGDLHGVDAVLGMMKQALARTQGTFSLTVQDVLANQTHAVALINWNANKGDRRLEGSEFAVFRIEGQKIKEVWFYQQDLRTDEAFWANDANS